MSKANIQADEDIDFSEIPEQGAESYENLVEAPIPHLYTALIDADVYQWFEANSNDHIDAMRKVLRDYVERRKAHS